MASSKISGGEIIARSLKHLGIDTIFTIVGDHVLPVLDVIGDSGFRLIDTRHEQAAVHMADAWGRITETPGVAMYTTPGFANAIPGLASALHAESPVLSISGSAELSELGRGAMQEIDQIGMALPVTKGAWMVTNPQLIPDAIAHAVRVAFGGRRGPVHLTIPVDVQEQEVAEDQVRFFGLEDHRLTARTRATEADLAEAIEVLRSASRPVVIAGSAASYDGSGDAIRRFIETTRLPLMTEADARGIVPDDHEYCLGFYDHGLNRAARRLKDADAVLLLGRKQDIIIGYALPPTLSADAEIIQIDPSASDIGRNRGVRVGIVGDVASVVEDLTAEASKHTWEDLPWLDELRAERLSQAEWLDSLAVPEAPMHAVFVHKTLEPFLRPDDVLVFEGGDFCHFGRAVYPALQPKGWWYFSGLGMLGSGLPNALAAKLAGPDRRVFLLTGDGAFGFNAMELDTAVRHNLPVVVVLGNDAAWGIDRQIQLELYGKPVAADLLPTRYDEVARGLGCHAEHVSQPEDLSGAIERGIAAGRPALINVEIQQRISPRAEAAVARWKRRGSVPF